MEAFLAGPEGDRPVRNRGGRPAKISRQQILDAAAALPLDDVTMTAVAARLGVKHSSLYTYFPSRAALIAAVCAETGPRVQVPDADELSWQQWVQEAGLQLRELLVANLTDGGAFLSGGMEAASVWLMQTFIEVLRSAGFSAPDIWTAWELFLGACLTAALRMRRLRTLQTDPSQLQVGQELLAHHERADTPMIPFVVDIVTQGLDFDRAFRRALDVIFLGLEHQNR